MSIYTRIGASLWNWAPFRKLERSHDDLVGRCTKLFWLALYTSPDAKMGVPGLYLGSVTAMADASGVQPDDARRYLDRLIEDEMVEYDQESRVLRLTMLPDCGESPCNNKAVLGWWRRFQTFPRCAVRDAHVTLLRWLIDEWYEINDNDKAKTAPKAVAIEEAWVETFGRMPAVARRSVVQKHVQTSLFSPTPEPPTPTSPGEGRSVDNSASDPKLKDLRDSDRDPIPNRLGIESHVIQIQDPDPGSRSLLPEAEPISGAPAPAGRPRLALVPMPALPPSEYTAAELAQSLWGRSLLARPLPAVAVEALTRAIGAGSDLARSRRGYELLAKLLCPTSISDGEISPEEVCEPGRLTALVQEAVEQERLMAEKLEMAAEARKQLGY